MIALYFFISEILEDFGNIHQSCSILKGGSSGGINNTITKLFAMKVSSIMWK